MSIAWITVNYRQEKLLPEWIDSIRRQQGGFANDIFVVDNSGTVNQSIEPAELFVPGDNLGYFRGFNHALDRITATNYAAVVMANPDICFDEAFATGIHAASLRCNRAMVIAPQITTAPGGVEQNPHVADGIGWMRRRYYDLLFSNYFTFCAAQRLRDVLAGNVQNRISSAEPRAIYMAHGSCFVLLPSFFDHYPKLDDRVFLWGEEALLRKQVADADGLIWYDPELRAVHHEHSATGAITSRRKFQLMKESYSVYRAAL